MAIAILLVGSATFSSAQAKKSGKVAVTVKNWNCNAHDMKYRIQTEAEEKTIGLKTFNFWYHEIECDEPTFTLSVPIKTKSLLSGEKLFACVLDVDQSDSWCGNNFTYKAGKKLHTTVNMHYPQMAHPDGGTIRNDTSD